MKKVLIYFLSGIFLAGCATQDGFRSEMNGYIGANIMEVYNRYGPPTYTQNYPNGQMAHTWVHNAGTVIAPVGNAHMAVERGCTFTFITGQDDLWIANGHWQGNTCRR